MSNYEPLLISYKEAAELRAEIGSESLMGRSIAAEQKAIDDYMAVPIEIPGHGEGGGYEHNRHKQNYIHANIAGRMYLITQDKRYRDYVADMLRGYADVYLSMTLNTSKDTNPPGRIFHQTLNENMWLLYASDAYSAIRDTLSQAERDHIVNKLFLPMVELFTETYAHDFDIVHNHGLWSVAGVGICGYAIERQDIVDKALYGLSGDSSKGFIAQLNQLFSPDGYYMEGPYYQRFAIRPMLLFAEIIERRQPDLGIFKIKDEVICLTSRAVMSMAFPDGTLPALNDSSKTMDINDEGIMIATSVCYTRDQASPTLVAMAQHQKKVWVSGAGLALSRAASKQAASHFNWGSLQLRDGAMGDQGGVSILRQNDGENDINMALIWYGQHGSDAKLHAALDHGHFDALHVSFFNRGQEVLQDYGYGRWVNIEPKFGGRYIPENKSYAKQTIAHNTVVVDETSQNKGDTATAQQKWGEDHFFVTDHAAGQGMSAFADGYYAGIDMQRSVLMLNMPGKKKPILLDLFRLVSEDEHQYDYPLHHIGQIIRTNFEYEGKAVAAPLGSQYGYQHLYELAKGEIAAGESTALVSWLAKDTYYTMLSALPQGGEVIFARIGANDPQFNLRSEPAILVRTKAKTQLFATVIESHGYFHEGSEVSVEARGQLSRVEIVGHNAEASVVRLYAEDKCISTVMVSNLRKVTSTTSNEVKFGDEVFRWNGAFEVK